MDHPHFDKDEEFAILGNLAVVENGGSVEVDDETLALYTAQTGKDAETSIAANPNMATGNEKISDKRKRLEKEAEKQAKATEAEASKKNAETEQGSSGDETTK
jgi:hypothetical protein